VRDGPSGKGRGEWELPALIALVAAVRLAYAGYSGIGYDDAHISLRYATNLAEGHGLVFNPGEHVFGASTPLYVLVLAVFAVARLPMPLLDGPAPLAWGKALCIAADAATAALWYRLLQRETDSRWPGRFFVLLFGLSPFIVETTVSGMETALVLLGMTVALARALNGSAPRPGGSDVWLGVCLGVLGLIRIDTVVFSAILLGSRAGWSRRLAWREALVAAACMAPWYLFAWHEYGSPVPNSILAKAAAYNAHIASYSRGLATLWTHILPNGSGFGADSFKLISSVMIGVGLLRLRAFPRLAVLPAFVLAYLAFLVLPRTLLFRWYLPPALMALYALAGVAVGGRWGSGLWPAAEQWRGSWARVGPWVPRGTVVALAVLWLALAVHTGIWTARMAGRARRIQWAENHVRREIGLWLRRNTPPDARIATEPIGYIGYYSRRPILDEVGLVSPAMIPLNRAGDGWFTRMLRTERPEYVVERYYYVTSNQTLNTGVRMFRSDAEQEWFEREYAPVRYYCLDLVGRLRLSPTMERDYGFVVYARRERLPSGARMIDPHREAHQEEPDRKAAG